MAPPKNAARRKPAASKVAALGPAEPLGAFAVSLLKYFQGGEPKPLIAVLQDSRRAETLSRIFAQIAPRLQVALLPAWDSLPYDRAPPSRAVMGRRAGTLRWLSNHQSPPDLVLTTTAAVIQRVPPQDIWRKAHIEFTVGDVLDLEQVEPRLRAVGYTFDDLVDNPGEFAIRGRVIDLFPAAAPMPCRIEHEDGRVTSIRSYDPLLQRTVAEADVLVVDPATEMIVLDTQSDENTDAPRSLAESYPELQTIFDYVPDAALFIEEDAVSQAQILFEQVAEAYEERRTARSGTSVGSSIAPPDKLYMSAAEWQAEVDRRWRATTADPPEGASRVPRFAHERNPRKAFAEFATGELKGGARVVVCAAAEAELAQLERRVERALERRPERVADWTAVLDARKRALLALLMPIDAGFVLADEGVVMVAAADLLGSRASNRPAQPDLQTRLPGGEIELRSGDVVVHLDHGLGILEGLESLPSAEPNGGGEALRLRYANDARLLVPVSEIGKVWRYGSDADAVSLDRLDAEAWSKRRLEVEAEIEATAAKMVKLARKSEAGVAEKLVPPRPEYERFAARFPYTPTADQSAAIEAVLSDLASARPMNRLVCGDVGYGKTEVALRAAAAAVLAGKQVALFAPTTVLVRQHVSSFRRRFAGFGIEVAHLSRLVKPAEARRVKQGLADGSIRMVIGTQALAGKTIRFKDLGLVIIDEEQRFGTAQKAKMRAAKDVHVLTLTATPIPRTLQAAMAGLNDLSVIATPPVARQRARTAAAPFDPAVIRDALMREKRHTGQSFVVCPRIEDIEPMADRLRSIAPELELLVAHGDMPPEDIDDIMLRFAEGDGDVLLATNIIESGLDVPNANTMIIWRPDRFGLAQLHQLRGRVGRGTRRGSIYLVADPAVKLNRAAEKRLRTLETLDGLGAGFAVSAHDLDLRGAGDLVGKEQAGHLKLVGLGLFQHLLQQALATARGERVDDWTPELRFPDNGHVPHDYVPETDMRIDIYSRLHRLSSDKDISDFEDEIEDRFGPMPEAMASLLRLVSLKVQCRELGIERIDAGPRAIAATPRHSPSASLIAAAERHGPAMSWSGERFVYATDNDANTSLPEITSRFLEELAALDSRKSGDGPFCSLLSRLRRTTLLNGPEAALP